MTVSSINSMDPICSKMMFRRDYSNKSSYGVIKILKKKQDIRKKIIFAFCDFVLLLVCQKYRSKEIITAKETFVAICFRFPVEAVFSAELVC